jgi:AcrR family transcriptional regulator
MAAAVASRGGARVGSARSRRGGALSEMQRARVLCSAMQVVAEVGYGQMTVARVASGARVSRRTFYDLFIDREDCFLAAFEDGIGRVSGVVLGACAGERSWQGQVRAGLEALLGFLDEEPSVGSLLVVDALRAGARVQERRAEVLQGIADALQRGGSQSASGRVLSPLAGEGVVGGVLGVIHTRLSAKRSGRMRDLLGSLMGMVVLPYLGPAAAQRELKRRSAAPDLTVRGGTSRAGLHFRSEVNVRPHGDPLAGLSMRVTDRTLLVVKAIGEQPGVNNREVSQWAGISDQGQMSKLLARLAKLGLVENTSQGQSHGEPNAWRLTARGSEVEQALRAHPSRTDHHRNGEAP